MQLQRQHQRRRPPPGFGRVRADRYAGRLERREREAFVGVTPGTAGGACRDAVERVAPGAGPVHQQPDVADGVEPAVPDGDDSVEGELEPGGAVVQCDAGGGQLVLGDGVVECQSRRVVGQVVRGDQGGGEPPFGVRTADTRDDRRHRGVGSAVRAEVTQPVHGGVEPPLGVCHVLPRVVQPGRVVGASPAALHALVEDARGPDGLLEGGEGVLVLLACFREGEVDREGVGDVGDVGDVGLGRIADGVRAEIRAPALALALARARSLARAPAHAGFGCGGGLVGSRRRGPGGRGGVRLLLVRTGHGGGARGRGGADRGGGRDRPGGAGLVGYRHPRCAGGVVQAAGGPGAARGERVVDGGRTGTGDALDDVLDGPQIAQRHGGRRIGLPTATGHAVLAVALSHQPAEHRLGRPAPVRHARVVQQGVEYGRVVPRLPLRRFLRGDGGVGGVEPPVQLVGVVRPGCPAQLDGLGVTGCRYEREVDMKLVTRSRQQQTVVQARVQERSHPALEPGEFVRGEALPGANRQVEGHVAHPAAVVGLDPLDPHPYAGLPAVERSGAGVLAGVQVRGRVDPFGPHRDGGRVVAARPPLLGPYRIGDRRGEFRRPRRHVRSGVRVRVGGGVCAGVCAGVGVGAAAGAGVGAVGRGVTGRCVAADGVRARSTGQVRAGRLR